VKARENPFRSERIESIPYIFPEDDSWELLLRRLGALGFRGAICGPEGSGKTTLLEELGRRVPDLVLVDAADLLPVRRFRRLEKSAGRLVITAHRVGLLPTLHRCRTSAGLLKQIVVQLVGPDAAARLPLEEIYAANEGDVRRALRHLYDIADCGFRVSD
jgi:hypothetical protein